MSGPWGIYLDDRNELPGDQDDDCHDFESFDEAESRSRKLAAYLAARHRGKAGEIVITWESHHIATVSVDALGRIWTDLCYADALPTDTKREINIVVAVQPEIRFVA